jgi:uracil-DNA glycosylase
MPEIAIVGEAYGEEEARQRAPFVGYTGQELTRMLSEAGIHRADCFLTNVFNIHPPGNDLRYFCGPKAEAIPGYPLFTQSRYVHERYAGELERLGEELIQFNPNIIIALGNTAMWALLGKTAISKVRGTTDISTHTVTGYKVLPTYHPSAVCRQWELRPVTILDLAKALRESEYPEVRRPKREIWIEPTLEDLETFYDRYIHGCKVLSVDIETSGNQITCIGFAPFLNIGIVIPFLDTRKKSRSYWRTDEDEKCAWRFVARVLSDARIRKTFQNGLYDIAFLWRAYGIRVMGAEHDTMLLHHALQPESLKGLGFLGSIYSDEGSWKHMRAKHDTIKQDD